MIIINADDCGISKVVDDQIEHCIENRLITSTTIMANMADFDGAVRLYNQYSEEVSFGWHMNLTEGEPLLKSQLLLDKGYYVEEDGKVVLNGKPFWKKPLSKEMIVDIKKELKAQYEKIRDYGVKITHADSHEHIHTSWSLWPIMPGFMKDLGVTRCRRMRNYVPSMTSRIARNIWSLPFKMKGIKMVDTFCSYQEYVDNPNLSQGKIIELMCHPGSHEYNFEDEYELLKKQIILKDVKKISYHDL